MPIKNIGKKCLILLIVCYLNAGQANEQSMEGLLKQLISVEKILEQANQAFDAQHFNEAILLYDQVISKQPNNEEIIYWASIAARAIKDYKREIDYLLTLKNLNFYNIKPRELLVQAYQNTGEFAKRDNEHQQIIQLWKDKKINEILYVRDRFEAGEYHVTVFAYFDFKGNIPRKYLFIPQKKEGQFPFVVLLQTAFKKMNDDPFYFLQVLDGKRIHSHAVFETEPSYDEIRKMAYKIIESGNLRNIKYPLGVPFITGIKEFIFGRKDSTPNGKSIHYQYAYKTLPEAFFNNPKQFFNFLDTQGTNYLKSLLFKLQDSKENKQENLNHQEIEYFKVSLSNNIIGIVKLPKPSNSPEAYYVATVIDKDNSNKNRYFTFEKMGLSTESDNEEAIFCELTPEGRMNYGVGIRSEPHQEDFLNIITDVLNGKIKAKIKTDKSTI